jgi:hypothetical protein
MTNLAGIVQQLRKERDQAARVVERLDAALAALNGSSYGKRTGQRRHLSAAARKRIAAAQRARWAKGAGEYRTKTERRQHAEKEDDVSRRSKENCRRSTSAVGEGEGCPEEVRLERNHPIWMLPSEGRRTTSGAGGLARRMRQRKVDSREEPPSGAFFVPNFGYISN